MTWFAPAARAAMDDAHVLPGLSLAGLADLDASLRSLGAPTPAEDPGRRSTP